METTPAAYADLNNRLAAILEALGTTAPDPAATDDVRSRALGVWEGIQAAVIRAEELTVSPDEDHPEARTGVCEALPHLRYASTPATLLYRAAMDPRGDAGEFEWAVRRVMRDLGRAADALVNVRY